MAIFLIKYTDTTHPDPAQDVMCYKRGDIVQVMEDTAHDGDLVKNPITGPFMLVKVLGVTKAQAEQYMAHDETIVNDADGKPRAVINRRRKFRLVLDSVPLAIRNQLINFKYIEVTKTQVQNYLQNKITSTTGMN